MVNSREIVIARYNEDVNWLLELPVTWKITIYNKGEPVPMKIQIRPNVTVIAIENKGREAETIAYHLLHRYDTVSDFTVFLQASPFDHAPELFECLSILHDKRSFSEYENYIPVTTRYNAEFPPPHITEQRDNRFFRIEDMSIYTLDCIEHIDTIGAPWITSQWYPQYEMPTGSNIMKYFFDSFGWTDAILPGELLLKFSYAACFGVTKAAILQHSRDFYARLYEKTFDKPIAPYILERAWLHIFDQRFDASKVLPEFALHNKVHHTRPPTKINNDIPKPLPQIENKSNSRTPAIRNTNRTMPRFFLFRNNKKRA